ncbi:uncharacterized protein ACLA_096250 [Aspergillus clavatus NRRL 1]|uniref:Uncharacterized protein n=1 Tax=Aspergillus clavatus (strain ATCC 1007 / CBS 513.65 / DSM 816 / NCTC 3887 / NRRL 1 / QM 1276 / 107) TaxID=344612 RepID=A1CMA5_ASPCL|nr:uncharacterized protein ACLA_096250 [Aspergillus clavatus NRRL 1]EAW08692.1 hypothetical protein ACLA_096250 [Aspergillus clavatus NRRL 1]
MTMEISTSISLASSELSRGLKTSQSRTSEWRRNDLTGLDQDLSLTTRQKPQLTRAHYNYMAIYVASDWAVASYRDHSCDRGGLVKTEHTANYYLCLILEAKGLG